MSKACISKGGEQCIKRVPLAQNSRSKRTNAEERPARYCTDALTAGSATSAEGGSILRGSWGEYCGVEE